MTDDPWINFFVILTVGANVVTLTLWGFAVAARFGRATNAWAQTREKYGWQDFAVSGDEFATFLNHERERVTGILTELGLIG